MFIEESRTLADLLVIDGNPLDDIRVLTTPDRTLNQRTAIRAQRAHRRDRRSHRRAGRPTRG
jgi:imidazolonepropionase-like amidohydrolase